MFHKPFPEVAFAKENEYRGFRARIKLSETAAQRQRRLRNSASVVTLVASIEAANADNDSLRLCTTRRSGILTPIAKRFFPDTTPQTIAGSQPIWNTSSARVGSSVDRQMEDFVKRLRLPTRSHRFARLIAEFCRLHSFYPLAAQLDLKVGSRWTAIDLVCLNNYTGKLVVFELKTGYDHHYETQCSQQPWIHFMPSVPNCWASHHQMQLAVMVHALTQPPLNVPRQMIEGYVLRVNDTDGVCKPLSMPKWFDSARVTRLMTLPLRKVRVELRRVERERMVEDD